MNKKLKKRIGEVKELVRKALEKLEEEKKKESISILTTTMRDKQTATMLGTPLSILRTIGTTVGNAGKEKPSIFIPLLEEIWKNGKREERIVVTFAMGQIGKTSYKEVLSILLNLSRDVQDWEICDNLGCWGIGPIIVANPGKVLPGLKIWTKDKYKWTRRAAIASMYTFIQSHPNMTDEVVGIIEPLMKDEDKDVQKGVSWIIREISQKDPQRTLQFMKEWLKEEAMNTRWIIANGSRKFGLEVIPLLKELAKDERKFVRRAAASALKDIGRSKNELIPILEGWNNDEDGYIKETANIALKYIRK